MEQFREPLNLIRNYAHILQEHNTVLTADELRTSAAAIEEQAEQALRVLDETTGSEAASPRGDAAYGLSEREMQVLRLLARGHADKQIAAELGISRFTVNKHVGGILEKMGAASRTEAGVRAVRDQLIED